MLRAVRKKQSALFVRDWVRKYPDLYKKQLETVDLVLDRRKFALFFGMGTGKTWIAARVIESLLSEEFSGLQVTLLNNIETTWVPVLQRLKGLTICRTWETFAKAPRPRLLLVHYEALRRIDPEVTSNEWTYSCFDEAHKLKDRGSAASRIAGRIKWSQYRLTLTGTPFDSLKKDPQQVWAHFRYAVPKLFGKKWGDFDEQYCKPAGYKGYYRVFRDKQCLEEVLDRISPYCRSFKVSDLGETPPPQFVEVPFELKGEQRRVYKEMERKFYSTLQNGVKIHAEILLTKRAKLLQICGGFIYDEDKVPHVVGREKLRMLSKIIRKESFPVVVFCKFLPEIDAVARRLRKRYGRVEIMSGATRKTRDEVQQKFQRGEIDVLVCQISSGGVGIDLFRSSVGVFYSSGWSYIDFDQAVHRLARPGQRNLVKFYLLYAKDTVDESAYEVVRDKELDNRHIMKGIQRRCRSILQTSLS